MVKAMKNKKFLFLGIIVMILVGIAITPKEFQNDLFYTIKVGEVITKNGIDFIDHFSWHSNLPYTYPHYLFDLLVYIVYNSFNYKGLYILEILLTSLLGITIFTINKKQTKNNVIPLILSILTMFFMKPFITLRAQIVTFTIFALTYYYLEQIYYTKNKKYIIGLALNVILINNFHIAVFPFFFIMFLPYIAEEVISYIKKLVNNKYKITIKHNKNLKLLFITILICLLASLITPLKTIPFTYLYNTLINDSMQFIEEHLPLVLKERIEIMIFLFSICTVLFVKKSKIKLHDLFMLLGLFLMTIISGRQGSLFILIGMFIFTKILCELIEKYSYDKELSEVLVKPFGVLITLVFVVSITFVPFTTNQHQDYINEELYPTKAVEFIKNNLNTDEMKLFNGYDFGSYLLLNDIKVFVDSRCDLYTYSYNKTADYFEEYSQVVNMNIYYEYIFSKYDITHIILPNKAALTQFLDNDVKYNTIYKDQYFTIYTRLS